MDPKPGPGRLTRTDFLRVSGITVAGILLAACKRPIKELVDNNPNKEALNKLELAMGIDVRMTDEEIARRLQELSDGGWGASQDLGNFIISTADPNNLGIAYPLKTGPDGEFAANSILTGPPSLPDPKRSYQFYKIGDGRFGLIAVLSQGEYILPPGLTEEQRTEQGFKGAPLSQIEDTLPGYIFRLMGPVENRNLEVSLILDINRSRGQRPYVRLDDDPTQPFILHLPLNWVGQMYAPIIGRDKPLTDEPNLEHILKFNLWWLTQVWARSRMTPLNFQTDGDNLGERIIKNNYGPATALGVLVMNDRRFGNSNKLRTWQERILGKESEHWVTLLIEPVVTEIGLYRQQSNPPTHSGGQG